MAYLPDHRLENFFDTGPFKPLKEVLTPAKMRPGIFRYESISTVDALHLVLTSPLGHSVEMMHRMCGYSPVELAVVAICTYGNGRTSEQYSRLGRFNYDMSNCGMAHIHHIAKPWRVKGIGTIILRALEEHLFLQRRKYITCSINSGQQMLGVGLWLEKHGYTKMDTFVGGNSGNECTLYVKDLDKKEFANPMRKELPIDE